MKRLLALLLVLCMVFSFAACKNSSGDGNEGGEQAGNVGGENGEETEWTYEYVENTGNFKVEELETGTNMAATSTTILNNNDLINPEKFEGKTLQIYGYSSAVYEDIDEMGKGSFIWMVRAAIAEWAALNKVKVEFVGGFDQNVITGDINSGGKPDILIYCNKFPSTAVSGIIRPFTQEEYDELAKTTGKYYLDMLNYKGQSYGVQSPWSGGTIHYFNKTLFEQYGVKSPAEYYKEGNWNWDTMEKCYEEITKDTDGDGKMDIYGSGTVFRAISPFEYTYNQATGKVENTIGQSPEVKRWLEINYKGFSQTKSLGAYVDCNVATTPRPATHMSDAEWYNFEHLYQELVNGDIINCVPVPRFTNTSDRYYQHTPVYSSILTSCDENEAALSLLNYTLRVGMRYMSDFSLGLYKCNYEGIRGACKYSYGWKQNFEQIVADRKAKFDELEEWDQELYDMLQSDVLNAEHHMLMMSFPGHVGLLNIKEASSMPPASSLPTIVQKAEAWINEYNNLNAK